MIATTKYTPRLALAAGLAALALTGCGSTPQLQGDPESLGAADALWTAVTAKEPNLLDASAARIAQLHDGGKMTDDAFAVLEDVIATARQGEWADARGALKDFVRGQRRVER